MPPKKPVSKLTKKASTAATPTSVNGLVDGVANLTIKPAVAKVEMPMLVYEWWRGGLKRLSIDMLMFSGLQHDHVSVIVKGEKSLIVKLLIPVYPLFDPSRLEHYNEEFNHTSARYAAMEGAAHEKLKGSSRPDEGCIDFEVKVDLPFSIEEDFSYKLEQYFPYTDEDPRYSDREKAEEGLHHMYSVLLVEMVAKEKKTSIKPATPSQVERRGIPTILGNGGMDDDSSP